MVKDGRMTTGRPEFGDGVPHLVERVADSRPRHVSADGPDDVLEDLPILAALDGRDVGTDQFDVVLLQHTRVGDRDRGVQRRLATEGGQQRVDGKAALQLVGQYLLDVFGGDRLDVGGVRELRVRHDRRRVRVDQRDADPLLAQAPGRPGCPSSRIRRPVR